MFQHKFRCDFRERERGREITCRFNPNGNNTVAKLKSSRISQLKLTNEIWDDLNLAAVLSPRGITSPRFISSAFLFHIRQLRVRSLIRSALEIQYDEEVRCNGGHHLKWSTKYETMFCISA